MSAKSTSRSTKRCSRCGKTKDIDQFGINRRRKDSLSIYCKPCLRSYYTQRRYADPRVNLDNAARSHAKEYNLIYQIGLEDIPLPQRCPYLGLRLDYTLLGNRQGNKGTACPSLSPVNPDLGYVPGNVEVVSSLVHHIKARATREQLVRIASEIVKRLGGV